MMMMMVMMMMMMMMNDDLDVRHVQHDTLDHTGQDHAADHSAHVGGENI